MPALPERANLAHLKTQAKELIRAYRSGDPGAVARFRRALPAAIGRSADEITGLGLRLHDAQSCIARDYGFASWADMASYVEAQAATQPDAPAARVQSWLALVYFGDITGRLSHAKPVVAARMLGDLPDLAEHDPYLACAVGDTAALDRATAYDPAWVNRAGGKLNLPPLIAVAHSTLIQVPEFRQRLLDSARHLLGAGADPNQRIGNRFPPASLERPDDAVPLSALYGAAGVNREPAMVTLLLEAGADPDDGESLYHSLENLDCTRLLLRHGARVTGTNALYRAFDMPDPAAIELLLAHGGDANEPARTKPTTDWGSPLLWAIRRRCSRRHVEALLAHGANTAVATPGGLTAYRLALQFGLTDVAEALARAGAGEPLSEAEQFVAACAVGDEAAALHIQAHRPDLPGSLPDWQHRLLPDMVAAENDDAAKLMVRLGWPIATPGGDWGASALNLAVFRGDPALADYLLAHGASWREQQGFGDDVAGTLAWASINEPSVSVADWAGCARVLLAHGMPNAEPDPEGDGIVRIDGRRLRFSEEVGDIVLGAGAAPS